MILHITKKLADKLKITPPIVEAKEDSFYSWRANYIQESGKRFIVFMNDETRFTVVLNEAKAAKLKKLPELFIRTLRETMLGFGINPEVIKQYILELGEITYAKNSDRKKTALLNKNVETVWYCFRDYTDDVGLSVCASGTMYHCYETEKGLIPKRQMIELLGKYNLPVRRFSAVDLNIRLELEGQDAVRRIRVPLNISFPRLHKVLQNAFGWRDCHLHIFGMFKEWNKDYYAEPDEELVLSEEDLWENKVRLLRWVVWCLNPLNNTK